MTLVVHAFGAYARYSRNDIPWRDEDYQILKLVKSLKGKEVKGTATITDVHGTRRQISNGSSVNARLIFGYWALKRLRELDLGPVRLVPVPSSKCVEFGNAGAALEMARWTHQIGRQTMPDLVVSSWLRFAQPMLSASSEGGTRNQAEIQAALRVSPDVQPCQAVLVDDVKTTGAHLRACAERLRQSGVSVSHVLVAASTSWTQHPTPLNVASEDIEPLPLSELFKRLRQIR